MVRIDAKEHLQRAFLFSGLSEPQLQSLADAMTEKSYLADDAVLTEGDDSYHGGMGVVLEGSLSVIHADHDAIGHIGVGDSFGELSLIDDEPRSATIVADETTRVAVLTRGEFRSQIRNNPEIALNLMKILSGRLREARGDNASAREQSF